MASFFNKKLLGSHHHHSKPQRGHHNRAAASSSKNTRSSVAVARGGAHTSPITAFRFGFLVVAMSLVGILKLEEARMGESAIESLHGDVLPAYRRALNVTADLHEKLLLREKRRLPGSIGSNGDRSDVVNNNSSSSIRKRIGAPGTGRNGGGGEEEEEEDSFGICLMIMDDNHFLVEWLAYNWFALPLRHLIVMVDPMSRTSPVPILDRWKTGSYFDTLQVVNWTYPGAITKPRPNMKPNSIWDSVVHRRHMAKQLKFFEDCLRRFKRMGASGPRWVAFVDTDEFLGVSSRGVSGGAGSSPASEPGSVMKELQREFQRRKALNVKQDYPDCWSVLRMQICVDGDDGETASSNEKGVVFPRELEGLTAMDFLTWRWPQAESPRRGKNLIRLDGVPLDYLDSLDLIEAMGSVHYVLPDRCSHVDDSKKRKKMNPDADDGVLRIYHYSGSAEQREFRSDPRGKFGSKDRAGTKPAAPDKCPMDAPAEDLKPWLRGFVEKVGPDEAERLLEGAGRVDSWPPWPAAGTDRDRETDS